MALSIIPRLYQLNGYKIIITVRTFSSEIDMKRVPVSESIQKGSGDISTNAKKGKFIEISKISKFRKYRNIENIMSLLEDND